MNSKDHSELRGTHAILSASKYTWLKYTDEQLYSNYVSSHAQQLGTCLHDLACDLITERIKLNKNDRHLVLHHLAKNHIPRNVYDLDFIYPNFMSYVNDAIGYRMQAEQVVYYSENAYGTADALDFRNKLLRIFDYKSGTTPAHMEQLMIYAAYYCLEHNIKPGSIDIELRIYQSNDIAICNPSAEDILPIMDRIISADKFISKLRAEGM